MTPSEQAKAEIPEGFYWVRANNCESWEVARYTPGNAFTWEFTGQDDACSTSVLAQIGPRILPPDANQ
jgi:hypothetical protein